MGLVIVIVNLGMALIFLIEGLKDLYKGNFPQSSETTRKDLVGFVIFGVLWAAICVIGLLKYPY